jgi:hypothetical protein
MAKTKKNEKDYIDKPVFFAALNDFFATVDISYEKTYGKSVTWRSEIFEKESSYEKWIKDHTKIWLENYYKQWLKVTKKTPKDIDAITAEEKKVIIKEILYPRWRDSEIFRLTKEERSKNWNGKPAIPRYIGECFLKISNHLSYRPNFVNYMFREEMISDGIENCVQYIYNFNNQKSDNAFAYFTQMVWYAFLRRIQKEKKQLEIKQKILSKSGFDEIMHTDDYGSDMKGMNKEYSEMTTIKENIETRMNR